VLTTWTTTTAKLAPGSRAILRLCSFVAPTPLPLTVLLGGIDVLLAESADVAGAALPAPSHAEFWVREQVQQLRAYSMVEGDSNSILLHPLVLKVEQLNLQRTSRPYQATLDRSLNWINTAFVGVPQDVRSCPCWTPWPPMPEWSRNMPIKSGSLSPRRGFWACSEPCSTPSLNTPMPNH